MDGGQGASLDPRLCHGHSVQRTRGVGDLERTKHSKSIGSSQARGFVETSLFQDCVKTKQSKINLY